MDQGSVYLIFIFAVYLTKLTETKLYRMHPVVCTILDYLYSDRQHNTFDVLFIFYIIRYILHVRATTLNLGRGYAQIRISKIRTWISRKSSH
jgi:hypothetical protein